MFMRPFDFHTTSRLLFYIVHKYFWDTRNSCFFIKKKNLDLLGFDAMSFRWVVPNAAKELAPSSSGVKSDTLSLDDDASHPRITETAVRKSYIFGGYGGENETFPATLEGCTVEE
jgi:hypothetical protein